MATLTQQDVEFYTTNGYFLYHHQLFSPDKLARLNAIFEEHLRDKGEKLSDELDTPHFRDPRLLDFLLSDEVLDLVQPLHLQGSLHRPQDALARGLGLLEGPHR